MNVNPCNQIGFAASFEFNCWCVRKDSTHYANGKKKIIGVTSTNQLSIFNTHVRQIYTGEKPMLSHHVAGRIKSGPLTMLLQRQGFGSAEITAAMVYLSRAGTCCCI